MGGGERRQQVSGKGQEAEHNKSFHNTGIQALPPAPPFTPLFEFSMHPPMAS